MSSKLSSLVQTGDDPVILLYVINNLGRGVPEHACFHGVVDKLRGDALRLLVTGQWRVNHRRIQQLEDQLMPILLDMRERQLTAQLFDQASTSLFLEKIIKDKPETLRHYLHHENLLVRITAISVIGRRHLHFETDLIERLNDPNPVIRDAARLALIRLSRGTDFGPYPGASKRGIGRSIDKWRHWLALQQEASPGIDKGAAVTAKPNKTDPIQPVQLLLADVNRELQTPRSEVARLREELVNAKEKEQRSLLVRWRDVSGSDHTDALVLAIPKLPEALRAEAEGVLTERLSHMASATLRDKLQDDIMEVRRAAAFACGRKLAKELIPDLVQILQDPEKDVIQAARAALTELTGEDFGPSKDANERSRAEAVAAWRNWCKEHAGTTK